MNFKNILFTLITILMVTVFAEIIFTIAFWIKDSAELHHQSSVKDSPYTYYIQEFNSSLTPVKDIGKFRIAIVGGSVARQLGGYNFLDSILNHRLNTSCIEVLNAGVDGFVVQQEFILTQLTVQKFKPDVIIGIDGYNDLMSYKLNRYINESGVIPPQNYRDFKVIEQGKEEQKFYHRFLVLFKNITRAADFFRNVLKGKSSGDYSKITDTELHAYGDYFSGTVKDLHLFCEAKGISYYNFVQPVRFYDNSSANYLRNNEGIEKLARLMRIFENHITKSDFGHSLTTVLNTNQDFYTDDCHMNEKGNMLLADAIAGYLIPRLEKDSVFLKVSGKNTAINAIAQ